MILHLTCNTIVVFTLPIIIKSNNTAITISKDNYNAIVKERHVRIASNSCTCVYVLYNYLQLNKTKRQVMFK